MYSILRNPMHSSSVKKCYQEKWLISGCYIQQGSRDRPDQGSKTMKKRHTETLQAESWDQVVWALGWRNHSTLEGQHIYYIELDREAGLLYTDKQEAEFVPYIWIKEAGLANPSRKDLSRQQSSDHKHPGQESWKLWCTDCQHSTNLVPQGKFLPCFWTLPQEEGFTIPPQILISGVFGLAGLCQPHTEDFSNLGLSVFHTRMGTETFY